MKMKIVYDMTNPVKIKNANGTAARKCKCGSWLAHWEIFSEQSSTKCSVTGCNENATLGAHITRPSAKNEDYKTHNYIAPMCSAHNGKHGEQFTSKSNLTFVWANVKETCGN